MAPTLTLRVITPDRIVVDSSVRAVRLPGVDGSIGVLPRHAPMVAALDVGLLRYRTDGRESVTVVSGGFAEVRGGTLRVVTESGEKPEEIDEERARRAEERARRRLDDGEDTGEGVLDVLRAELALKRAQTRLRAKGYAHTLV